MRFLLAAILALAITASAEAQTTAQKVDIIWGYLQKKDPAGFPPAPAPDPTPQPDPTPDPQPNPQPDDTPVAHNGRTIDFGGYTWDIVNQRKSPGPTTYSPKMVYLDRSGRLHLKIDRDTDGQWKGSWLIRPSMGYGHYRWDVSSDIRTQVLSQPTPVFAFWTYDWQTRANGYANEFDIEYGWFHETRMNKPLSAQAVVIPVGAGYPLNSPNWKTWIHNTPDPTINEFFWRPGSVQIKVTNKRTNEVLVDFTYTRGNSPVPVPAKEDINMALWIYNGVAPQRPVHIIIDSFQYRKL